MKRNFSVLGLALLFTSLSEGLNVMPPWKSVLKPEELRELLGYVRSLAK
jgi:hypothetical protein